MLIDLDDGMDPQLSEKNIADVCANPLLPQVFRPVCHGRAAGGVLSELGKTTDRGETGNKTELF